MTMLVLNYNYHLTSITVIAYIKSALLLSVNCWCRYCSCCTVFSNSLVVQLRFCFLGWGAFSEASFFLFSWFRKTAPSNIALSLSMRFLSQFTVSVLPSITYWQGTSRPYPLPRFTLSPVILQDKDLERICRNWQRCREYDSGTWPTTLLSFMIATAYLSFLI